MCFYSVNRVIGYEEAYKLDKVIQADKNVQEFVKEQINAGQNPIYWGGIEVQNFLQTIV